MPQSQLRCPPLVKGIKGSSLKTLGETLLAVRQLTSATHSSSAKKPKAFENREDRKLAINFAVSFVSGLSFEVWFHLVTDQLTVPVDDTRHRAVKFRRSAGARTQILIRNAVNRPREPVWHRLAGRRGGDLPRDCNRGPGCSRGRAPERPSLFVRPASAFLTLTDRGPGILLQAERGSRPNKQRGSFGSPTPATTRSSVTIPRKVPAAAPRQSMQRVRAAD